MPLQKNPLTVVGVLTRCWLFTYQTPAEDAQRLLPPPLQAVTHRGWAFWNIVVCQIRSMRPQGLPAVLGVGYWHVGYRLYVRYPADDGTEIEGLYFVRSDCDNAWMTAAGNLMTDFHFHTAPIHVGPQADTLTIAIESPDAPARVCLHPQATAELPAWSAFETRDEAAAFLKYKPFGISVNNAGDANIVRIVRDEAAWQSTLVPVESAQWAFFADKNVRAEICFQVEPIVYQWQRGRLSHPRRGEQRTIPV